MEVETYSITARKQPPGAGLTDVRQNFSLRRESPRSLEAWLSEPDVSLYSIDLHRGQVAFVSTPPQVDLSKDAFFYSAQFKHAQTLYMLGMDDFHKAARLRPTACDQTILLYSVGRCGSTLLSRVFANVPDSLSVSEPDAFSHIAAARQRGALSARTARELLRSASGLLFLRAPSAKWRILKFRSEVTLLQEDLTAALPEAFPVFMYRSAIPVIESYDRIWGHLYVRSRWLYRNPVIGPLYRTWRRALHSLKPASVARFEAVSGGVAPAEVLARMGLCGFFMLEWLLKVDAYQKLRNARPDAVAIRYEDLVKDPQATVAALLSACGMPSMSPASIADALAHDSQEGTDIQRQPPSLLRLDPSDHRQIHEFFEKHTGLGSPDARLPGTL